MKIKYIIDTPREGKFTITKVETGYTSRKVAEKNVRDFLEKNADVTFLSAKADVALRSVPQREVFPGARSALAAL